MGTFWWLMKWLARLPLTAWPSLSRDSLSLPSDAVWGLCWALHAVSHFFIFWWQYDPENQQISAQNIKVPVKGGETHLTLFLLFHFLTNSWKQSLWLRVAAFWLYFSILVNDEVFKEIGTCFRKKFLIPSRWKIWSAQVLPIWECDFTSSLSDHVCKVCACWRGSASTQLALSKSSLPLHRFVLQSGREALQWACKWEACWVLRS